MEEKNYCRYFQQGNCRFGDYCNFLHEIPETPSSHLINNNIPSEEIDTKEILCKFYGITGCRFGDNCKFKHVTIEKTRKEKFPMQKIEFELCSCFHLEYEPTSVKKRKKCIKIRKISHSWYPLAKIVGYSSLELENLFGFPQTDSSVSLQNFLASPTSSPGNLFWSFKFSSSICLQIRNATPINEFGNFEWIIEGNLKHVSCLLQWVEKNIGLTFIKVSQTESYSYMEYCPYVSGKYIPQFQSRVKELVYKYHRIKMAKMNNNINMEEDSLDGDCSELKSFISSNYQYCSFEDEINENEKLLQNGNFTHDQAKSIENSIVFFGSEDDSDDDDSTDNDDIENGDNDNRGKNIIELAKDEDNIEKKYFSDFEISYAKNDKIFFANDFKKIIEKPKILTNFYTSTNAGEGSLLFSDHGKKILSTQSAGCSWSSQLSEALSFEVLYRIFNASLTHCEMDINYSQVNCPKIDYRCEIEGVSIGVSVTRAWNGSYQYSRKEAAHLLTKKIKSILHANQYALSSSKWEKQLLHVWLPSSKICPLMEEELKIIFEQYEAQGEVLSNLIILLTVTNFQNTPLNFAYLYRS